MGVAASCFRGCFARKGTGALQKIDEERCLAAKPQDIRQKVKTWSQLGLPKGQGS